MARATKPNRGARPPAGPKTASVPTNGRSIRNGLLACATLGVGLRLLLSWANPPANTFDDHFGPILWILDHGRIAPKDALWQAYQPPVFYVLSAGAGAVLRWLETSQAVFLESLQLLACLFGVLTLLVTYPILNQVRLSASASLVAFGSACFLTRHIYQSAMHSNDTLVNLGTAGCVLLMLHARRRSFPVSHSVALGLAMSATVFTKYNGFVVLPAVTTLLATVRPRRDGVSAGRLAAAWGFGLVLPLLLLAAYGFDNWRTYGQVLPWNTAILDPALRQPRAPEGLRFLTFEPWRFLSTPLLVPWNLGSFWTILHAGTWFDVEPKFLPYLHPDHSWWLDYLAWLRGQGRFREAIAWTPTTHAMGSGIIGLGLVPLALSAIGLVALVREAFGRAGRVARPELLVFPVLLAFNAAGIVYLTMRSPVFSSIKATYLLNSLAAWAVLIGFGWAWVESRPRLRAVTLGALALLFTLVTLHVLEIVFALAPQNSVLST